MKFPMACLFPLLALPGCATDTPSANSGDYEELDTATVIDSPSPAVGAYFPADRELIDRGAYMIRLLACGSCHTDGAFDGAPDLERALAGSNTGIAFSNPLGDELPGIVFPANITPDEATGIGRWSDQQVGDAIRAGIGRHGGRRISTMPWQGYSDLTDDDVAAIVAYLRSIEPVSHELPREVAPGQRAVEPFVYFGVYRSKQ